MLFTMATFELVFKLVRMINVSKHLPLFYFHIFTKAVKSIFADE